MKCKFNVGFSVEIEYDENEMTEQEAIEEITSSMSFPCEDTDNVVIIEHVVIKVPRIPKFNVGDEVYWTDPDNGAWSDNYKVSNISDDGNQFVYMLENECSETEAFENELS